MTDTPLDVSGLPLTPLFAYRILLRCFDERQQWTRDELINRVEKEHLNAGGIRGKQPTRLVVKRALADLRAEGSIQSVAKGIWRAAGGNTPIRNEADVALGAEDESENEADTDVRSLVKQIGKGSGSVYIYFNDNDRKLAGYEQREVWECKVGHTSGDVWTRLLDQGVRTSQSQIPTVGLIIRTDDPAELEGILHRCLRLADRSVPNAAVEWFFTSPAHVEAWYVEFVKALAAIA